MVMTMGDIMLGTSGWSYREWIGPFYKKGVKSMLSAYTKVFQTVEINSTFYRYPTKSMAMGWQRYSPAEFVFIAKIPRLITHEKRLDLDQGVENDLTRFCKLMEPLSLNGKLGCLLIQLPPSLEFDPELVESFFKILPSNISFAVEFRDLSWMTEETWELLRKYQVAYTIVDEPLLPPEIQLTSKIAYFRWHGKGTRPWYNYRYDKEELKPWVPKVKEIAGKADKVYGFFNNHYHGYAVENCLQVLEMLGELKPRQIEAKTNIENYFETLSRIEKPSLEAFIASEIRINGTTEELLKALIDSQRLRRAQQIKDQELTIEEETEKQVKAKIRDYRVIVDLEKRLIMHDCSDWERVSREKRFCKHIGKLFLLLEKEKTSEILEQILVEKESWEFRPYPK
jgi:uncharacterized protein YecE (DUF72 family)